MTLLVWGGVAQGQVLAVEVHHCDNLVFLFFRTNANVRALLAINVVAMSPTGNSIINNQPQDSLQSMVSALYKEISPDVFG